MQKENNGFKTRLGFILAAAGSAIGLGNLWSFPAKAGMNGGAAFVFVYIIMALLIGVVGMIAEMYIGKRTGKNIIDSYNSVNKRLTWIGVLGVLSTTVIASYYIVLGGWVLKYAFGYLIGTDMQIPFEGAAGTMPENYNPYEAYFGQFSSGSWEPILFMFIFFALGMLILVFGVQNGIEKISKILMPVLLVLMVILMIRSLTLDPVGVKAGLEFYLKPKFNELTPSAVLAAMGQAFFSLSLGVGTMCVYGSYAKDQKALGKSALSVVLLDTMVALLAGFMIFPAIFAFGKEPTGGPGLFFIVMPEIFDNMAGGRFFGFLFFFLVFVAAITSVISMVEVALQTTIEKTKIKRPVAVVIFTILIFLLGCIVSLSMGFAKGLQIPNPNGGPALTLLDFLDAIIQTYVMPVGTVMACVIVGWILKKNELDDQFGNGKVKSVWLFLVKYITPILVSFIFIFGMFGKLPNGKWGFVNWKVTLTAFVMLAVAITTNQIIVTVKQKKGLYSLANSNIADKLITPETSETETEVVDNTANDSATDNNEE